MHGVREEVKVLLMVGKVPGGFFDEVEEVGLPSAVVHDLVLFCFRPHCARSSTIWSVTSKLPVVAYDGSRKGRRRSSETPILPCKPGRRIPARAVYLYRYIR